MPSRSRPTGGTARAAVAAGRSAWRVPGRLRRACVTAGATSRGAGAAGGGRAAGPGGRRRAAPPGRGARAAAGPRGRAGAATVAARSARDEDASAGESGRGAARVARGAGARAGAGRRARSGRARAPGGSARVRPRRPARPGMRRRRGWPTPSASCVRARQEHATAEVCVTSARPRRPTCSRRGGPTRRPKRACPKGSIRRGARRAGRRRRPAERRCTGATRPRRTSSGASATWPPTGPGWRRCSRRRRRGAGDGDPAARLPALRGRCAEDRECPRRGQARIDDARSRRAAQLDAAEARAAAGRATGLQALLAEGGADDEAEFRRRLRAARAPQRARGSRGARPRRARPARRPR